MNSTLPLIMAAREIMFMAGLVAILLLFITLYLGLKYELGIKFVEGVEWVIKSTRKLWRKLCD